MKNKLILFVICFSLSYSFSQDYFIKYINTEIEIDGVEDKLWSEVSKSSDYWQWRPSDSIKAKKLSIYRPQAVASPTAPTGEGIVLTRRACHVEV